MSTDTPENLLPFDLTTALEHPERVVTRSGQHLQALHLWPEPYASELTYPLTGLLDGMNYTWNKNGIFYIYLPSHSLDLFLQPPELHLQVAIRLDPEDRPMDATLAQSTIHRAWLADPTNRIITTTLTLPEARNAE